MSCSSCGATLERPRDFCLKCSTATAVACLVRVDGNTAVVQTLDEEGVVDAETITYVEETGKLARRAYRNFIGRIVDVVRRKRPSRVYVAAPASVQRELRARLAYEMFTAPQSEDVVDEILTHVNTANLPTVDTRPRDKLGGSHSTVIGGRNGKRATEVLAENAHVKKVIPGPIDGGGRAGGGFEVSVSRVDETGNLRVLLKEGGTVQTVRVVTTGQTREHGEAIARTLRDAVDEAF